MKEDFGSNVQKIRLKRGMSLKKLAEMADASRSMITKIEKNMSVPNVFLAARIAKALGVSISQLLEETLIEDVTIVPLEQRIVEISQADQIKREIVMPYNSKDGVEILSFVMPAGSATGKIPAYQAGTFEYVFVEEGTIKIIIHDRGYLLKIGDCLRFLAQVDHEVINMGPEQATYKVITVAKTSK